MILLAAATEMEIKPILESLPPGVETIITGVGAPIALFHLQQKMAGFNYSFAIQMGISGSFSEDLMPGETVIIGHDRFADIGAEENEGFQSIFELGLANENSFPFENGWLVNHDPVMDRLPYNKIKSITVNTISGNKEINNRYLNKYGPQAETMEGAAFHYVCLMHQIPFLQVRTISNKVGVRDKSKWSIKEAVENLNKEGQKIIELIRSSL